MITTTQSLNTNTSRIFTQHVDTLHIDQIKVMINKISQTNVLI